MAYSVDIIYSKNTDYSDPQTVTENGLPTSIDIENLDVETTYYVKALLKNDGVIEDEDNDKFTTLSAGTIALTHQSSTREGDNYVVVYTYTSTYALSSSILRCGETIATQGVIAGNTITYTVSGLTAGVEYTCEITTIDIYTGTNIDTFTLTMPIVNKIDITNTFPSETEVEVGLEYTVDGGFGSGWVDYWLDVDDPSTDQPQGHETFSNGDDTCTVTGLTAGTTYLFKATILLYDDTTEISSSVVTATTSSPVVDKTEYFHITNTSNAVGKFYITRFNSPTTTPNLKYSFDTVNWNTADLTANFSLEVAAGTNVYMKGTNTSGFSDGMGHYYRMSMNVSHSIGGNIMSIVDEANYTTITSIPHSCFNNLFREDAYLINAGDVNFGSVTSIGDYGCQAMYYDCTSLTTPTDLSNITSVGIMGCSGMFRGCTSLTTPTDLSNITSVGDEFDGIYRYCSSLTTAIAPNIPTWNTNYFDNWLYGVAPTGVVYKPANLTIPTNSTSGVPTGWTTQDY